MFINPTPSQVKAIDTDGAVLVSAAAGSGKTAVLTERVIRKLTDTNKPVSADELLIVTFTNDAANEMRRRIEARLFEECRKYPNDPFLIKQKHLIGSADICTIDSFCINLVRENFEKCGVEPNFKVSDGNDMKFICDNVLTDIINERLENDKNSIQKLLELCGCDYDDSPLKELIRSLYIYSRQLPFPNEFLSNLAKPYETDFDKNHIWYSSFFELAREELLIAKNSCKKMAELSLSFVEGAKGADEYAKTVSLILGDLEDAIDSLDYNSVYEKIKTSVLGKFTVKSINGDIGDSYKEEKNKIKVCLSNIQCLFCDNLDTINKTNAEKLPTVRLLIELVNEYANREIAAYKEQNKLTFYHTEQMALELLCETDDENNIVVKETAKPYISKYAEVLVDEFQDVNDLQNMLFYILSGKQKRLFTVGDIKQSIYRFRGSNLNNFLDKKRTYIPIDDAKDDQPKKIILSDNFRSRKGVCDYINFFFNSIMREDTGDIIYDEEERLNSSAKFPESDIVNTELLVLQKDSDNDDSRIDYESKAVAKYIKDLIQNKTLVKADKVTLRPARYDDICILIEKPNTNEKMSGVVKELVKNKIPVSFSGDSFCDAPEISLALSLLKVIDNPANDIELLTVMMSPLYSFTPDEMALMRLDCRDGDIYSAVLYACNTGNSKALSFIKSIQRLRNEAVLLPIDKLVTKIIYETDLFAIVSAMEDGEKKKNTLLSLISFSANSPDNSISGFIKYLSNLPEKSFNDNSFKQNSVRITSMHKSKGLQFPICILLDLSTPIKRNNSDYTVFYSEKYGLGYKYFDENQNEYVENIGKKVITKQIAKENLQEKMRLLYVAMTRAEEKLVLVTSFSKLESSIQKISNNIENGKITAEFIKKANSMSEWIIATSLLHPDANELRAISNTFIEPCFTESKLKVTLLNGNLPEENFEAQSNEALPNKDISKKIIENANGKYYYEPLSKIESKTSVSKLVHGAEGDKYLFNSRPAFMNEKGMSASEKGTAMHNVMQYINMTENIDVDSEIERLYEWQFITEAQAKCVDRAKLSDFFESNLYKRICNSKTVRREMRFLTEIPACRLDKTISKDFENEKIIVQGAVDLLFEEDDGIVIVDFKTDRVEDDTALINAYSEQLEIYSSACEKIFLKRIKEKIIYSFALSKEIVV